MNTDLKIKADTKRGFFTFILFFGGLGFCFISYYLISASLKDAYPQLIPIGLGAFFGFFGLLSLYFISKLDGLNIYSDRLDIISIFQYKKRTIYLDEIASWTEIEKQNKQNKWHDLTIYTDTGKYVISSSLYTNYPQIKSALIKGKPKDSQKQNTWYKVNARQWAAGFAVIGCAFIYLGYYIYKNQEVTLNYSDIITLKQQVTSEISINKGSKGSHSLKLKLKDYPEFDFDVDGYCYPVTDVGSFLSSVKTNDTLLIDIKKDQYLMKLTKEKPPGFFDKTINYQFISVYGLRSKNRDFLRLNDYNKELKSQGPWAAWFFGLFGFGLIIVGFFQLNTYKK